MLASSVLRLVRL
ncbi:hypothetical protein Tco_0562966, partial [Tanacetum coccineum]